MQTDDKRLIQGCLSQDKEAWDTFVERYSPVISHAILHTLKRYSVDYAMEVVDDLFQSVFFSLLKDNSKKIRQFQWKCKLSSWLHIISVRVTIDYLRKRSLHLSLNGETKEEVSLKEKITNGNPLSIDLIEEKEEKSIFEQVRKSLSARERLFVELYYIREHTPAEVARILNTTKNNVYQLKSIVREKMKEIVKEKYKISAT